MANFLVVDVSSAYNAIMGRLTLSALRAIPSTYHHMVKFILLEGREQYVVVTR